MSDSPPQYILSKDEWTYFRSCEKKLADSRQLLEEIESLRQQLAAALVIIEGLNGRFAKDQDRIACQAEQLATQAAQPTTKTVKTI